MFKKTLVASAIGGLLVAPLAAAAPVTVSDSQSITSAGQLFNFNFLSLPTTGTAGQLRITLDGDYSGFDSEAASVTLDVAGGTLRIGDSTQVNGVTSNTISGLTVGSYNSSTASFNDTQQNWVFDLSDSLLAALLAAVGRGRRPSLPGSTRLGQGGLGGIDLAIGKHLENGQSLVLT